MRLGIVRGHVVLHLAVPELRGTRLVIVEPVTAENLAAGNGRGGGKSLVVADHLDPGLGQTVGFVEGREAANPYWPGKAPVDAYCALLVDAADFRPPDEEGKAPVPPGQDKRDRRAFTTFAGQTVQLPGQARG